jgi:hypothetical protein
MSGLYDFLDTLGTAAGNLAGRAVDGVRDVKIAQANAQTPARVPDQASAAPAATLSASLGFGGAPGVAWIIGGLVVLVAVVLLVKR